MIGKTISHYKILEKLGEGGMGVVYKAEDTKLKRTVALKFLPTEFTRDENAKERFLREAQAAAALEHSNICNIHEIGETEKGQLFIVMACYEGESLKDKIEKGPLKLKTALDIAIQIAQGLTKAHEKGIVHRDIKSANIHLTADGVVKILDFGLAKLGDRTHLTKEHTTLGTVTHMSPEQVHGVEVDSRTDIWSLGVVLHNMITGLLPFKGDYQQAVEYAIINENPEAITCLRTGVPMELERIVNKALAKNPDERYQTVKDMKVDLKNVKAELTSTGKTVITQETQKPSQKKSLNKLVFAAGIVIILAIVFWIFKSTLFKDDFVAAKIPIAVMPFENRTGDDSLKDLSETIQDLLITKLGNSKYLYVMTRERMNDLLKQMGKQDTTIDKELGYELCRRDSVETIVIGSINKAGDTFITDVKVLDVETKKLIGSASEHGQEISSIFTSQIDKLGDKISRSVGLTARKIADNQKPIVEMTTSNTEAYQHYIKGTSEYFNSNYEDARIMFEKAVQLDSTFAIAYLYLAGCYGDLRNPKGYKNAYEKAKEFSKNAPRKERLLIEAYYIMEIENNEKKAIKIFEQLIEEYPKEKISYNVLASSYTRQGLYDKAVATFNRALQLDPQFGWAYTGLAYTYNDFEKRLSTLKQYASAVPKQASPYDELGTRYYYMGQLDEAISNYQEAVKIQPEYYSNYKIAYIYALKEDYAEAREWIEHYITNARSTGPKAEGYWWLAFYNMWTGKIEQAINDMYQLKGFAKDFADDNLQSSLDWTLAWFYYEKRDYNNSYKLFNRNFELGLVELATGRLDSAKSRLEKVKFDNDPWHNLHYNIFYSEVLLAQDSLKKAIYIQKAITPVFAGNLEVQNLASLNVPFIKDVFARAYYKNGEIDKAIEEYERLITFDPNSWERFLIHPKYHYRLAKLYEEKGVTEKAIKEYKKFLDIWKDADKDLSELIDAKERYAKLSGEK